MVMKLQGKGLAESLQYHPPVPTPEELLLLFLVYVQCGTYS